MHIPIQIYHFQIAEASPGGWDDIDLVVRRIELLKGKRHVFTRGQPFQLASVQLGKGFVSGDRRRNRDWTKA
jgi:hypothetical protein